MPTIHEIKEQIHEQRNPKYLTSGVLKLLPLILAEDEVYKTAEIVRVDGSLTSLIATNKGLTYVTCFSPGNSVTETFFYPEILSISIQESDYLNERFQDITVEDNEKKITFSQVEKSGLDDLLSVINTTGYLTKEKTDGMLRYVKVVQDENELPLMAE